MIWLGAAELSLLCDATQVFICVPSLLSIFSKFFQIIRINIPVGTPLAYVSGMEAATSIQRERMDDGGDFTVSYSLKKQFL